MTIRMNRNGNDLADVELHNGTLRIKSLHPENPHKTIADLRETYCALERVRADLAEFPARA
jgi:hypothetical protein